MGCLAVTLSGYLMSSSFVSCCWCVVSTRWAGCAIQVAFMYRLMCLLSASCEQCMPSTLYKSLLAFTVCQPWMMRLAQTASALRRVGCPNQIQTHGQMHIDPPCTYIPQVCFAYSNPQWGMIMLQLFWLCSCTVTLSKVSKTPFNGTMDIMQLPLRVPLFCELCQMP